MNLLEIYLDYSQMLYLRHLPLACKKTADITGRENLLLVISALYLNVGLNLMTLSIEDAYYVCIQERYNKAAERKQKLHEKYIALCNLTHREIDRIEDGTIAMGLRLHGVQQLSWKDTAEQLGVPDIQDRCYDYLKEEDDIFLW